MTTPSIVGLLIHIIKKDMSRKFYKEENEIIPAIKYSDVQPSGYIEVIEENELNQLYVERLRGMRIFGLEYIESFSVEKFGSNYRDGILTAENVDYILNRLSHVILLLSQGFIEQSVWNLQNKINVITQTDIDNGYTQIIHDEIIQDLINQINQ